MSETTQRKHHPDCPALFFTDKPQRCRCMFLAVLDRPRVTPPQAARDLLAETLLIAARHGHHIALDDATEPHYWRHLADAILASPALDAIVAERVAALADDEAVVERAAAWLGSEEDALRAISAVASMLDDALARSICASHQTGSPTRQPCAACSDLAAALTDRGGLTHE